MFLFVSILDLIILWTWKPAWRPHLVTEADMEKYYEQAWAELNADNIRQGLWAQLYSDNKGDVEKTKAPKCIRCWNYSFQRGPDDKNICLKCHEQLIL